MRSSQLVQLSPYLLLEYIYGDATSTYEVSADKPSRISNAYTGEKLFINGNASRNTTGNVLDFSAANIGGVNWAVLDRDVPVPYITQDPNLTLSDLSIPLASLNIMYDTLRIHIQSGYNFDNIEGLLFQSYVREALTTKMTNFAANVILKGTDRLNYNPSPFYMTDKVYDRFLDIMIPSLKAANDDYYVDPSNKNSIGGQYASDGNGFLLNSNVYVKAVEIDTVTKKNGITYFKTNAEYLVSVRQSDLYGSVAAVVREASDGDYFEFFPTQNGAFIEELIFDLNSQGGDYVVINQIDVIEQVGYEFINTFTFTSMQSGGFDAPCTFRPILKYADISPSFSLDYTARIYNKENAFQIIKKASTSSYFPRRYGKNLEKISLSNVTSPLKVYNKVYSGQQIQYSTSEISQFTTVYVPVFFDSHNLFVGAKNVLAEGANPISPNFSSDDIYFGQGYVRLYIGDFDQYFRFSVHQLDTKANSMNHIDLSKLNMNIGFNDSTDKLFTISALPSTAENSLSIGEIVFKIDNKTRQRMGLTSGMTKSFYLLSINDNGDYIKMYSGTVQTDDNISNEAARVSSIGSQAVTLTELATRSASSATASTSGQSISPNLGASASSGSLISQINAANVLTVKADNTAMIVNPIIPGFTTDDNAQNMTSITPSASK